MSQYIKVVNRSGKSFRAIPSTGVDSPNAPDEIRTGFAGWTIAPASIPYSLTCSAWRDGVTYGSSQAGGHRDWYRLGDSGTAEERLAIAYKQPNSASWTTFPLTYPPIGSILNRMSLAYPSDDNAPNGALNSPPGFDAAPVILLGTASDADVRIARTPREPCEVRSITVTWSSKSSAAAEVIAATLPGLLDDRTAARVAYYEAYQTYGGHSNEAGAALALAAPAVSAHGAAYLAYTLAIRAALLLQL